VLLTIQVFWEWRCSWTRESSKMDQQSCSSVQWALVYPEMFVLTVCIVVGVCCSTGSRITRNVWRCTKQNVFFLYCVMFALCMRPVSLEQWPFDLFFSYCVKCIFSCSTGPQVLSGENSYCN